MIAAVVVTRGRGRMFIARRKIIFVCAVAAVLGGVAVTSAFASFRGERGRIAFDDGRTFPSEIGSMNADGSNQTQLTFDDASNQVPMWTPDRRIVWSKRTGPGQWDLWIMNADGSRQQRLTLLDGAELWPSPSPEGNRVAFAGTQIDG